MRIASWVLVFVAIGSAAAAWFTPREIEPGDARRVALGAMDAAGVEDAEVNEPIADGVHVPTPDSGDPGDRGDIDPSAVESEQPDAGSTSSANGEGGTAPEATSELPERPSTETSSVEPKEAWIVFVEADDATIEFRVDQDAGELLYVDDLVGPDKQERFFTDEQWETVRHYRDGKLSSWVGRNAMGSMAAVLIVGAGFVLAKRSDLVRSDSD